ncbi:MAG: shikimate kinase [Lachnospiraceae bacterium]|nr:shikimate kinase [Lachnospiraceae bacterium]
MKDNNYVLIGYMGAGKTTVGKALAKETGKKFLDTDSLIVKQMNLSINDIFEKYGEDYFRDLETKLIMNLCESANDCVISCGGGLPMREENRTYLKRLGKVVYLNVNETDILKRLKNDTTRPLLRGPKEEVKIRIHDMIEKRDPLYREAADVVIKTGRHKVNEVVSKIIKE